MAKYLALWELDISKIPDDPVEKKKAWDAAMDGVRQVIKEGIATDWGVFLGASAGFTINEGEPEEIYAANLKWVPMCRLKLIPFISLDQAQKVVKESA